jgi:hypothetical protein
VRLNRLVRFRILLLSLLIYVPTCALADTIHLVNGDRLSGQLLKIGEDKLVFKTEYAGELSIALAMVVSVASERAIELRLKSGESVNAALNVDAPGYALVSGQRIALRDLRYEAVRANEHAEPAATEVRQPQNELQGRAEASIESLQNKTQTRYAEMDLNVTWQRNAWRHTVDTKKRIDSEDGKKTEDSQKREYAVDYFWTPNWFTRGNSFYQRDRVTANSDLSYNGLGLGRNIWQDKHVSWELLGTYNKLMIGAEPNQFSLNAWIVSTEFKRKFDDEKWDIYAKADAIFPQHIPINLILQSEAGLRYQLNARVYLSAKLMLDMLQFSGGHIKNHSYKLGIGTKW